MCLAVSCSFASSCYLADEQHTCQMKPSDVSVAIIPFVKTFTCECAQTHTHPQRDLPTNLHLPTSNCFHVAPKDAELNSFFFNNLPTETQKTAISYTV